MTLSGPHEVRSRRFDGRIALVIGASSGIGEAIARRLAAEGASVVLGARRVDRVTTIAEEIVDGGGTAIAVRCDVRDEASIERAVTSTVEGFGRMDVAVNNGAIFSPPGSGIPELHELVDSDFDEVLRVNLRGVALSMKYEIRTMLLSGGGAILNTSSIAAIRSSGKSFEYSASKSALNSLTSSAAVAYGPMGIRVNAVAPGHTMTEMFAPFVDTAEQRETFIIRTPLRRIGHPDDIAAAAAFLVSDDSRFITGVVLAVDGGITL